MMRKQFKFDFKQILTVRIFHYRWLMLCLMLQILIGYFCLVFFWFFAKLKRKKKKYFLIYFLVILVPNSTSFLLHAVYPAKL